MVLVTITKCLCSKFFVHFPSQAGTVAHFVCFPPAPTLRAVWNTLTQVHPNTAVPCLVSGSWALGVWAKFFHQNLAKEQGKFFSKNLLIPRFCLKINFLVNSVWPVLWCFASIHMELLGVSVRQFWRSPGVIPIFSCQVWDDSCSSPAWKCIMRVSWVFFLKPLSENSPLLLSVLCGHLCADPSCAPLPPSHLALMFCFILGLVWSRKPKLTPAQSDRGLPSPQGVCTALGGHNFTLNSSESISSAPLETVHDPCFSLARVLCWGEASAWWFSAAAKESFLLPLPSQSPQTLPLPPEPCSGTGHWNFHWGMFSFLSTTGISFFLITGVRCWSDWQITCDQHREKLHFLYLWFSSLFCAVFLSLCWFERCTRTEMSLLSEFVVLGICFKKVTQPSWLFFSITKQGRGWEDHPAVLLCWQGFWDAVEDGLSDALGTCHSSCGPRWVVAAHPVKCRATEGMSRG